MEFDTYQERASKTDIVADDDLKKIYIPFTGLIGEVGSLIAEYKKYLRDGKAYAHFTDHMKEEIGDVLWYIATLARRYDIKLSQVSNKILMLKKPNSLPLLELGTKEKAIDANNISAFQSYAATLQRLDVAEEKNLFVTLINMSKKTSFLIDEFMGTKDIYERETIMQIGLGSILWQLSHIANIRKINLSEIAQENIDKIFSRWPENNVEPTPLFDAEYPEHEQFPRKLEILFKGYQKEDGTDYTIISCNGIQIGDRLTDNTNDETGYRFHDAIHYSFMSVIGWSPVMRRLFKVKRKSNAQKDEVDDGARALIIEEAIVGLVYNYARDQKLLVGQTEVDHQLIKIIQRLSRDLEVKHIKPWEWRKAIIDGVSVFRELIDNKEGILILDLNQRKIEYKKI